MHRNTMQITSPVPSIKFDKASYPTCASPHAAYSSGQLNVFLHDCDSLGVNGAKIRVLEEMDEESFCGFLERLDGLRLPAHFFTHWAVLKGNLSNLDAPLII